MVVFDGVVYLDREYEVFTNPIAGHVNADEEEELDKDDGECQLLVDSYSRVLQPVIPNKCTKAKS